MANLAQADLRQRNLSSVLRILHLHGPMRRADLTATCGLTRSSVLSLVDELEELGLAVESEGVATARPGRPSGLVAPNTARVAVATAEIAVDRVRIALIGLGGSVLAREDLDLRPRTEQPAAVLRAVSERLDALVESGRPRVSLFGMGLAVHAMVDRSGQLVAAPNLRWKPPVALDEPWTNREVPFVVGNDATLGAVAEHRWGAGRGARDLVYLSSERGLGGGVIANGSVVTGPRGFAGEVGHLRIRPSDGRRCGCGGVGCWETEVGATALLQKAGRPRSSTDAVLSSVATDRAAAEAVQDVATWLGFGIASLVQVVHPERVVVGGYLARVLELYPGAVAEGLAMRSMPELAKLVEIVPAELGPDAALVGVAELAFDDLVADPAGAVRRYAERRAAERSRGRRVTTVADGGSL